MPLTVELVSLVLGVRHIAGTVDIDSVTLSQAWFLEFDAMGAMKDTIQNGIARGLDCRL